MPGIGHVVGRYMHWLDRIPAVTRVRTVYDVSIAVLRYVKDQDVPYVVKFTLDLLMGLMLPF
jgi:hypothetical protein